MRLAVKSTMEAVLRAVGCRETVLLPSRARGVSSSLGEPRSRQTRSLGWPGSCVAGSQLQAQRCAAPLIEGHDGESQLSSAALASFVRVPNAARNGNCGLYALDQSQRNTSDSSDEHARAIRAAVAAAARDMWHVPFLTFPSLGDCVSAEHPQFEANDMILQDAYIAFVESNGEFGTVEFEIFALTNDCYIEIFDAQLWMERRLRRAELLLGRHGRPSWDPICILFSTIVDGAGNSCCHHELARPPQARRSPAPQSIEVSVTNDIPCIPEGDYRCIPVEQWRYDELLQGSDWHKLQQRLNSLEGVRQSNAGSDTASVEPLTQDGDASQVTPESCALSSPTPEVPAELDTPHCSEGDVAHALTPSVDQVEGAGNVRGREDASSQEQSARSGDHVSLVSPHVPSSGPLSDSGLQPQDGVIQVDLAAVRAPAVQDAIAVLRARISYDWLHELTAVMPLEALQSIGARGYPERVAVSRALAALDRRGWLPTTFVGMPPLNLVFSIATCAPPSTEVSDRRAAILASENVWIAHPPRGGAEVQERKNGRANAVAATVDQPPRQIRILQRVGPPSRPIVRVPLVQELALPPAVRELRYRAARQRLLGLTRVRLQVGRDGRVKAIVSPRPDVYSTRCDAR